MLELLLVDDDAALREGLGMALAGKFHVRTAASAEEALSAMAEAVPDVMVLDEQLPGMSGTELLGRLRQVGPPSVLMLSGTADFKLARRAIRLGAYDLMAKPFQLGELVARIGEAAKHVRHRPLED